jgi:hypothetical protein
MIVARSLCRVLLHQRREVRGNLRLSGQTLSNALPVVLARSRTASRLMPAEHAYRRPQQTHEGPPFVDKGPSDRLVLVAAYISALARLPLVCSDVLKEWVEAPSLELYRKINGREIVAAVIATLGRDRVRLAEWSANGQYGANFELPPLAA